MAATLKKQSCTKCYDLKTIDITKPLPSNYNDGRTVIFFIRKFFHQCMQCMGLDSAPFWEILYLYITMNQNL